jgi:Dual specificity phosphatase, catalytic domain.
MTRIRYDGPGTLHITNIDTAFQMPKDRFDRIITTCQDSIEDNVPADVTYSFHCMSDGPANEYGGYHSYYMFEQAADELHDSLADDSTVLIHCHVGQSRSVSVASAALARLLGTSQPDALSLIHEYRDVFAYPDDLLLEHAQDYVRDAVW